MNIIHWLDTAAIDFRHALRVCGRNPGFTAVGVLTLMLGIGASTALACCMPVTRDAGRPSRGATLRMKFVRI